MTVNTSKITDYPSALAFLFGRIDYERTRSVPYRSRRFKLDRMRDFMARLGNPEQSFPAIHIAGTKGKGSTAAMMAAALSMSGLRTGLYTSPHLHRLEERFVVDGQQCTAEELVELIARIEPVVARMDHAAQGRGDTKGPTYFEITTAAALLHFRQRNVDCAVLEVGLGGRLDSTNICRPAVSIITSISFDHTRQLGKTLAAIAGEKAGIIKPSVPVITGVEQPEPLTVIRQVAAEKKAPMVAIGRDFHFRYLERFEGSRDAAPPPDSWPVNGLDYFENIDGRSSAWLGVGVGLIGRHQAANAAVALAALSQLRQAGWSVREAGVRRGLAQVRCPARIEVAGRKPTIVLDAAHNCASVAALVDVLQTRFNTGPGLLIFATSVDKDAAGMLKLLLPRFERVVVTRYLNNPRAVAPETLADHCRTLSGSWGSAAPQVHTATNPQTAWRLVRQHASRAHLVCVTGSFFLAAEMREQMDLAIAEAAVAEAAVAEAAKASDASARRPTPGPSPGGSGYEDA